MIRLARDGADRHARHRRLPILPRPVPAERPTLRDVVASALTPEDLALLADRPRTRGECAGGERPCPWVGCRHHLCLDVNVETGSIKLAYEDLELAPETCSLDVADRGEQTLEGVGIVLNVVRERVRQIEKNASAVLAIALKRARLRPEHLSPLTEATNDWKGT